MLAFVVLGAGLGGSALVNRFLYYSLGQAGKGQASIQEIAGVVGKFWDTGFEKRAELAKNANLDPLQFTIEYIATLSPSTVLVQRHVQDPDFLSEHRAYYSKWTRKVKRYCTRIHFFKPDCTHLGVPDCSGANGNDSDEKQELHNDPCLKLIDHLFEEDKKADKSKVGNQIYLGFITLRPVPMCPVGPTILSHEGYLQSNHFVLSKEIFDVNMGGRTFQVEGTPFLQQDNAVVACAQSSLWMSLRTLSKKSKHENFTPAKISELATKFSITTKALPNKQGLRLEQMTEAIRACGYDPNPIHLRMGRNGMPISDVDLAYNKSVVYDYVESGVPVILILYCDEQTSHAVTVIGHGWNADKNSVSKVKLQEHYSDQLQELVTYYDASSWVSDFVIHNDNTGPYQILPDRKSPTTRYSLDQAFIAIPMVKADIYTSGEEAKESSMKLLLRSFQGFVEVDPSKPPQPMNIGPKKLIPDMVARTMLITRSEFRQRMIDSELPEKAINYFRSKWLPRLFWLTELNAVDKYEKGPDGKAKRLGFVLLDSCADGKEGQYLSVYLSPDLIQTSNNAGMIVDKDLKKGAVKVLSIQSSGKQKDSPLVRI